jgi:two-component system sensor histidine kinase UhpB
MIQTHNIKSIACIPALHQGELKAMLYLENRQMPDVFTLERVEILKHLSSQFGVSVENALLYDSLDRKVRELQESEERYELAVSGSAAGLWDWDLRTDKVYYSDRLKELFGYRPDEFLDTLDEFWNRLHSDDYEAVQLAVDQHLKERVPYIIDFRLQTKSGEYRWFHARGQALWDKTGEATRMSGSIADITDRKQAEEAVRESERKLRQNESVLRGLAGRLIFAQEEERRRLAGELHDDLAQRLAVVAIDAGRLELQLMDRPAPVRQALGEIKNGIVKISQDVHSLSRQLHPSILDDLGLIKAVESECAGFMNREGIEIVFIHEDIPRVIPKDVSLSLYRIIQEGLRNISKHACAQHISVSLQGIDNDVLLSVQDDGIGFDRAEVRKNPGLGFSSMGERARLIHGEFSIKSQPEKGTVITVRAPLTREGE